MKGFNKKYDILVIGGGAGGLNVAKDAASLGLSVALVERSNSLGGIGLNYGCVPMGAFIEVAKSIESLKEVNLLGIRRAKPSFKFKDIVSKVVEKQEEAMLKNISKEDLIKLGVDVFLSETPKFINKRNVKVGRKVLSFKRAIIATGASKKILDVKGINRVGFLHNKDLFWLDKLPQKIAIIGGEPDGIEKAYFFSQMGVNVTVITYKDFILAKEDQDVSIFMESKLKDDGVKFIKGHKVIKLEKEDGKKIIYLSNDNILEVDDIVVAVGKKPNVDEMDLEKAGIKYTKKGIVVDDELMTFSKNIYAIGEVAGGHMFAHTSKYHAKMVLGNIVSLVRKSIKNAPVPWVIFTNPEIARVGITEKEIQERYVKHRIFKYDFRDVKKAIILGKTDGFIKVISTYDGRILGVSIVGPGASELISEFVLAISAGLRLSDISKAIHPFPTLSVISESVSDLFFEEKVFSKSSIFLTKFFKKFWF